MLLLNVNAALIFLLQSFFLIFLPFSYFLPFSNFLSFSYFFTFSYLSFSYIFTFSYLSFSYFFIGAVSVISGLALFIGKIWVMTVAGIGGYYYMQGQYDNKVCIVSVHRERSMFKQSYFSKKKKKKKEEKLR